MNIHSLGILENYKDLGVGIVEFALDDYVSTIKSLRTYYKKLEKCFEKDFKAKKYNQRMGDVLNQIYHKIKNLNDIETFLTGSWVKALTDLDVDMLFRETKKELRKKGYKVELMGLIAQTDNYGVKIFANEVKGENYSFTNYSIGISKKDKDSNGWTNGFISCKFKKGVTVANKSEIKINSSFFFPSKYKDKVTMTLMITDFEVLRQGETAGSDSDGFMKIPENVEDEMPFL